MFPWNLTASIRGHNARFSEYYHYGESYGSHQISFRAALITSLCILALGVWLISQSNIPTKIGGPVFLITLGSLGTLISTYMLWKAKKSEPPSGAGIPPRPYHFWNFAQTAAQLTAASSPKLGLKFGEEYGAAMAMVFLVAFIAIGSLAAGFGSIAVRDMKTMIIGFSLGVTSIAVIALSMRVLDKIKKDVNQKMHMDQNEIFLSDLAAMVCRC